jgi:long-chain acyl-CoA synthetase
VSISQRIFEVLHLDASAPSIIVDDHSQPWDFVSKYADHLSSLVDGQNSGLAIGIIARNKPAPAAAVAACIALGHCYVTLSPMYSDSALIEDLQSLELHVIMAEKSELSRPGVMRAAAATGAAIVEIGEDPMDPFRVVHQGKAGAGRRREGVVIEMLSSGTTGVPKRISLTYENLEAAIGTSGPKSKRVDTPQPHLQDRPSMVWHPIAHISGAICFLESISVGRPTILMERFEPVAWSRLIERYGVRLIHLNPTAMRMVLEANIEAEQLSSVKVVRSGTAATPPDLQREFEDRYGLPVLTTYGATEFTGAVASWSREDHLTFGRSHIGSSGRAHPGVKLRTVDPETGRILALGEEGVLEVLAPQSVGKATTWARTTDLAVIDEDGFLWIRGRVDDAILRGGFKVHPTKVEQALKDHPSVLEAAVIGLDDKRLGAVPVAAVTIRPEADVPTSDELIDFVKLKLNAYEVPRQLLIVDTLPVTLSMKVSRPALRALFEI